MVVECLTFCRDLVSEDVGPVIFGEFSDIVVPDFPIQFGFKTFVKFRLNRSESGIHRYRIEFIDDDGQLLSVLVEDEQEFYVSDGEVYERFRLFGEGSVPFQRPGLCAVRFYFDGAQAFDLPVRVIKAELPVGL